MTTEKPRIEAQVPPVAFKGQTAQRREPKPANHQDLDAEIVRDLEVDEDSGQVRGGACPTSRPV